jgi:FtsP/CotA-like multicopper oxidase with cupredoxin domain
MNEMMMLMNGYELDYDVPARFTIPHPGGEGEEAEEAEHKNEIYTVNGYAFGYMHHPIQLETNKQYRIYHVNMLEFDLINSFHVHGTLFEYQPSAIPQGTFVNDIVTLSQGDRGVLELNFPLEGKYMFHAHQTEFTDKGWMGFFEATPHSFSKFAEPAAGMDDNI